MSDQPQVESQHSQEASAEKLQAQELEKLEQSFTKVSSYKDPLKYEQALVKESRDLSIPLDEYRRLYELSRKKSSTSKKILNGFWKWTGFGEKRLWDFLQLLLVPLFIYGATSYLQDKAKARQDEAQKEAKEREKEAAKDRANQEALAATDRANQETLNSYLDTMTKLSPNLRQGKIPDDVKSIAKTRTLMALRTLDSERSGQLLVFLREAKLIGKEPSKAPTSDSQNANLPSANLKNADLIDFKNANLRGANLKNADLSGVDLSNAILAKADLSGAKFIGAILTKADFTDAKLDDADFSNASLTQSTLSSKEDIDKVKANFCGAITNDKGKKIIQGCSTYVYVTASIGLVVRDLPAGKPTGSRGSRARVELEGKTSYVEGRNWSKIKDEDGAKNGGWVASDYLSLQPPSENTSSPDPIDK